MSTQSECACAAAPTLIFACSGASDVGEIADKATRELTRQGAGRMFCLAGIGGKVSGIVESTRSAPKVLVLDGCKLNCARKTMEHGGFDSFDHLRMTDLSMEKGKAPASDERVSRAVEEAKSRLKG